MKFAPLRGLPIAQRWPDGACSWRVELKRASHWISLLTSMTAHEVAPPAAHDSRLNGTLRERQGDLDRVFAG
jgi:hypothetical protein